MHIIREPASREGSSKPELILIRGLPGSGKTTLAEQIMKEWKEIRDGRGRQVKSCKLIAADDFFMVDGEYKFDPSKLSEAHAWCQRETRESLTSRTELIHRVSGMGQPPQWLAKVRFYYSRDHFTPNHTYEYDCVIVHNTFTQRWEMEPYLDMADLFGAITVIDLGEAGLTDEELAERNSHGVPVEAITRMSDRFESDWVSYGDWEEVSDADD